MEIKKYSYKKIRDKVKNFVEKECRKKINIYTYDTWNHHIVPVVNFSKTLANKLKADKEIVELSALLHDIGAIKGDPENHHISGAKEAEKILKKFNYPEEKIKQIQYCIYTHRGSKPQKKETVEAKCVAAADAMAHFDDLPSIFSLAFSKHKMSIDDGSTWIKEKIERDWKKMIPEAKELMRDKYKAIKSILS